MTESGFFFKDNENITLFLKNDSFKFELTLPKKETKKPEIREVIQAWALGIATIPGSGIPLYEVEKFFDYLDVYFPVEGHSCLYRPKFREF